MNSVWKHLVLCGVAALGLSIAVAEDNKPENKPTKSAVKKADPAFDQLRVIKVTGKNKGNTLQTLCSDADGNILAVVARSRYEAPSESDSSKESGSEIQVFSPEGKKLRTWNISIAAQAINVAKNGTVYVAGDGYIATFDAQGKQLSKMELPHIAEATKNKEKLLEAAKKEVKQQKDSFEKMMKQYADQLKKLEDKDEKDRTTVEKARIKQYKQIIEQNEQAKKYYDDMTPESVMNQNLSRMRYINSVAITEKDVFIVCGETVGYGFAAWRLDKDLANPKKVAENLSGCCGQMDLQCCDDCFLVANNGQKKFIKYDREGKKLGAWGKAGDKDPEAFGGCCNPMNVRTGASGDIFTSESEGIVKRFNSKGEFQEIVAKAKVSGGCKNVAIAVSPKEDLVYFCDSPESRILVFAKKKTVTQK